MKLLTNFTLASCLLLLPFTSKAQLKIEAGFKGGLNFSSLDLNGAGKLVQTSYNSRNGFHIGGYAQFRVAKLAVQPELIFSTQGQDFSSQYYSNLNTSFSYINIPFVLKYYLVGGLNLQVGPQIGFLVGSKGDLVTTGSSQAIYKYGQSLKDFTNSTDFSIVFGAGIDLPYGANIGVRYNLGISDINKNTNSSNVGVATPSFSTAYTKNQVLQVSVGYRLFKAGK